MEVTGAGASEGGDGTSGEGGLGANPTPTVGELAAQLEKVRRLLAPTVAEELEAKGLDKREAKSTRYHNFYFSAHDQSVDRALRLLQSVQAEEGAQEMKETVLLLQNAKHNLRQDQGELQRLTNEAYELRSKRDQAAELLNNFLSIHHREVVAWELLADKRVEEVRQAEQRRSAEALQKLEVSHASHVDKLHTAINTLETQIHELRLTTDQTQTQMEAELGQAVKRRESEVTFLQEQLIAEQKRTAEWRSKCEDLTKQFSQNISAHNVTVLEFREQLEEQASKTELLALQLDSAQVTIDSNNRRFKASNLKVASRLAKSWMRVWFERWQVYAAHSAQHRHSLMNINVTINQAKEEMMQNVEKEQSSTIAALAKERMRVHEERENSKYLRQTVTELECQLKRIQSIMKMREDAQSTMATTWHFTPLRVSTTGATRDKWTTLHQCPEGPPHGFNDPWAFMDSELGCTSNFGRPKPA